MLLTRTLKSQSGIEVPTKVCSKCQTEKEVSQFNKLARSSDGLNYWCRACANAAKTASKAKKPDYYRQQDKVWKACNKDKVAQYRKRTYLKNIEYYRAQGRLYYAQNRDRIMYKSRLWRQANKERVRAYCKSRYPLIKDAANMRRRLRPLHVKARLNSIRREKYWNGGRTSILQAEKLKVSRLSDSYVKALLGLHNAPDHLICMKREQVLIKRATKQLMAVLEEKKDGDE